MTPTARRFGYFAGVDANDDVRASFSSQLDSLKGQDRGPAEKSTTIYQRAMSMISDLVRYNAWDSSWAPVALGGYYGSADIRQQLDNIAYNNKPAVSATSPAPAIPPPPPVISATATPVASVPVRTSEPSIIVVPSAPVKSNMPMLLGIGAVGVVLLILVMKR